MVLRKVLLLTSSILFTLGIIISNPNTSFADNNYIYSKKFTSPENSDFVSRNIETSEVEYYKINSSKNNPDEELSTGEYNPSKDNSQFSIIGGDGRFKVTDTTKFPYSAICKIEITWPNGDVSPGTAWMYHDNIAITAGHCVYDNQRGGWAKTIKVLPGKNGSSNPYGMAYSRTMHTSSNWVNGESDLYDYALLELDRNIGNNTGWFGLKYTPSSLTGKNVSVTGYPVEKSSQMWSMSGNIASSSSNKLYYSIDTTGGQSGSPIYWRDSEYGHMGVGIHAYGVTSSSSKNSGTRITKYMFDLFNSFR